MSEPRDQNEGVPSSVAHRAAVLGHPIEHSLSPVLHRAAYEALALKDWSYEAIDVTEDQLAAFLDGLDGSWVGLSLTMPLKRRVVPMLDELSPLAGALGVVNTVTFDDGRRVGDNTDVYGIAAALREAGCERAGWGCVLGGGATAVSALAALAQLGCRTPTVYVRSRGRSRKLREAAARLGVQATVSGWEDAWEALSADVVVSTVPTGAADALAEELENGTAPTSGPLLLDVVYDPWPTRLAEAWRVRGGELVDGAQMLLHQAVAQVRLMTGEEPPVQAMREALARLRSAGAVGPEGTAGPEGAVEPVGAVRPEGAVGPEGAVEPVGAVRPEGMVGPEGSVQAEGSFGPAERVEPSASARPTEQAPVPGSAEPAASAVSAEPPGSPEPGGSTDRSGPVEPAEDQAG